MRILFTNRYAIILSVLFCILQSGLYAQSERYPPLTGKFTGKREPLSPDPIMGYSWANPKATDELESYRLQPVEWTATANLDTRNFNKQQVIEVNGTGSVCFDFGQVNAGWLEFESPDLNGVVEMSISEFNQPPVKASSYPLKTMQPKKYGQTYRLELNPELYEGVRFGWINIISFTKTWHIKNVRLVCQTKPVNYQGSFSCSDSLLTKIWYTGAYTVKLNLLKEYLGAILMNRGDRYSWTGDAYSAQAAAMVAFGNYDFVSQNIAHTAAQSNGIRSYALYWVLSLLDYYQYTGDKKNFAAYIDNACTKLDDAYRVFGTQPNLEFYGWDERLGAGFEHPNLPEPQYAYQMLSIRLWHDFAAAMGTYGRKDLQGKYDRYAKEKMWELRKNPAWYQHFGLHAGADAITTGMLEPAEKNTLYQRHFTDPVSRLSYSPFNQFFIIQAFAQLQRYDDALASIRDLWGGQINYGATTFFEDYRPSWNSVVEKNGPIPNNQCGFTSLCHPWGAGVTKWLSEEVLGIKPTRPGFASFDIIPHLGTSLSSVKGTIPTPKGLISAKFDLKTGKCSFKIPANTVGRIGIPKTGRKISKVSLNGKLLWNKSFHVTKGIQGASEDEDFVYLNGVQSGQYQIQVDYIGKSAQYQQVVPIFAAQFLSADYGTSGNWGGKFGKDGYVLCNYEGNGKDRQLLPNYVSAIEYYKIKGNNLPLNVIWQTDVNDKRAPAPDPANGFPRNASCLYAMDPDQVGYTFTTTIKLKQPHDYVVSLYFLDWDDKGREMAVEMFDAETLKLISPVQVIKHFKKGAYLSYRYNRSVKFRFNMIRGDNAVLSGVFFDPVTK